MTTDNQIEQEIQEKGLTAPRITPDHIKNIIVEEHYFTAANGIDGADPTLDKVYGSSLELLTFCVLVLENGFTVTGESACVSPENFNAEKGRNIARENAINKERLNNFHSSKVVDATGSQFEGLRLREKTAEFHPA